MLLEVNFHLEANKFLGERVNLKKSPVVSKSNLESQNISQKRKRYKLKNKIK